MSEDKISSEGLELTAEAAYDEGYARGNESGREEGFDDACIWMLSKLRDSEAMARAAVDRAAMKLAADYLEAKIAELPAERPQ